MPINQLRYRLLNTKRRIERELMRRNAAKPHHIGICGSYKTGNIGDKAIGAALMKELPNEKESPKLFFKDIGNTNSEITVLGGGGVIHDIDQESFDNRLDFLGDNSALLGVGAPGIRKKSNREKLSGKLDQANMITVRDQRSKEILSDLTSSEITVTACPAFKLNPPQTDTNGQTGVNFRPWFYQNSEDLVRYFNYDSDINPEYAKKRYIENAKALVKKLDNPIFIPFDKGDEEFCKKHLNIDSYNYTGSVRETLSRVSRTEQMVCTRYHSLIFSIICEKPVISINYAPKIQQLANNVDIESFDPEEERIELNFKHPEGLDDLVERSDKNFKIFREKFSSTP